ncbi:MAG: DUF4838 domain-containing protein, partial [Planctomycetota bacterium]|nr:DUF4838 domain-containing protein [Planctomycetota bacterium]
KALCVIVVPPGSMAWDGSSDALPRTPNESELEQRRRLLRDSVRDLALYLEKISGAKFEIVEGLPAREKRLPIYIGSESQKLFGPVGRPKAGLFGFRVVVGKKGLGLYGESEYGTSYAIYELLHRLGCRWFMPTELGECVPQLSRLTLPEIDESLAPATEYRGMWHGGADFLRRNRMNGIRVNGAHALEGYISKEQREAHPDWCLKVGGKPHPYMLRWTRQDVADAIADRLLQQLAGCDPAVSTSSSISPGDYVVPTDDPEEMKYDPTPRIWEPAASQWSVSDRLILLANRIADRVGKKFPNVRFGLYIYVNYSMPPVKQKVHPNVIPMFAPIDFNRMHPMTWPNHPNKTWLVDMVQGWSKVAQRTAFRGYGFNLAELSAPNPFITKWATDIPILMNNNCAYWMPETKGGFESMLPGYYLGTRLPFDPTLKPEVVLQDLMERFYGAAAEPMSRYWHRMDRAWLEANEYAGCGFGYLRMFTPEVLKDARTAINEALSKCRTIPEYRRVELANESLTLFELFMKMRRDWAAGRLNSLADDYTLWRSSILYLNGRYGGDIAFGGVYGTVSYPDRFYGVAYKEASRVAREFAPLAPPLLRWQYCYDKEEKAEALGWTKPEFDDTGWKTTQVVEETWSTLGHHNTMGRMAYRARVSLAAAPTDKKAFLWIGSTDGSAKLFVNGQHVKYVEPGKTEERDAFSGYCQPATFDIGAAMKPGANQITILCERKWLNELGAGGLMGPVVVYRSR